MSSTLTKVQTALETAWATDPLVDYPVQYQNMSAPDVDTAWCRVWFMPNPPAPVRVGPSPQTYADRVTGTFQIDIFYPIGIGSAQERTDFELIRARFAPTKTFSYDGANVTIMTCGKTTTTEDGRYRCMITITFLAYIDR